MANELQRTVVILAPHCAHESAIRAAIDQADFVLIHEEQTVLNAAQVQALTPLQLPASFANQSVTLLVIERLDAINTWAQIKSSLDAASFWSPAISSQDQITTMATLFPKPFPVQRTFAMIKPDAVSAGHTQSIIADIEKHGFTIVARKKLQLTASQAEEFYAELKGMTNRKTGLPVLPPLLDFMTSGPVVAMVLAKPAAIRTWRKVIGPTDPEQARAEKPHCIRARFGSLLPKNACHGSDEKPGSVDREVKFFFPELPRESLPSADQIHDTLSAKPPAADNIRGTATKTLNQVLVNGLAELCRKKPQGLDAVRHLAHYLLQNNPNKPQVEEPEESVSQAAYSSASSASKYHCVFVLGGPGCGKGTQCSLIVKEFGFVHISAGDELRKFVASGVPEAKEIQRIMNEGKIVPYDVTLGLLKKAMDESSGTRFLIDGFPRALDQAFAFEKKLGSCAFVLNFVAPDEVLKGRIMKRSLTSSRADDNEETVNKRLVTFHQQTEPVTEFYSQFNKVRNIDATGSVEHVFEQVKKVFSHM